MGTGGLWLAVIGSGLYHGLNPGMGWPLAVSAGLMERRPGALAAALAPLSLGHLAAMLVVLLPFTMLFALVEWHRAIQVAASLLVLAFGVLLLVRRRHPRVLARIPPARLALWSFAIATAHGAGLMLVPAYLGLCLSADAERIDKAVSAFAGGNLETAVAVALVHSVVMLAAGGLCAWLVYRFLGLRFIARSWFNLDRIWAASLVLVGAISLLASLLSA